MTRIRFAGVELTLDADRVWSVTQDNGKDASVVRPIEVFLNRGYGPEWEPEFGVYEPSLANAAARAVAIDLAGEILELEPIELTLKRLAY